MIGGYTRYFPAAYSEGRDRFGVCAMTSTTIDDVRDHELICPVKPEQHWRLRRLLIKLDIGCATYLIGDDTHTPLRNQPDTVFLIFFDQDDHDRFLMAACTEEWWDG